MQNGLKLGVLHKQGIRSILDYIAEVGKMENISSVWNNFLEASYLLNRDFVIEALTQPIPTPLKVGKNIIQNRTVTG